MKSAVLAVLLLLAVSSAQAQTQASAKPDPAPPPIRVEAGGFYSGTSNGFGAWRSFDAQVGIRGSRRFILVSIYISGRCARPARTRTSPSSLT